MFSIIHRHLGIKYKNTKKYCDDLLKLLIITLCAPSAVVLQECVATIVSNYIVTI